MAKQLPEEVLALIPTGIENLVLRCTVCGGPLPASRRSIGDHAGACHKVRVLHRRYMIQLSKCISCLHPSTPEQREEFKAWRKSRGDIREKGGRPKKSLDKESADFRTPDIALCDTKQPETPQ
jgi:hypothetical protein